MDAKTYPNAAVRRWFKNIVAYRIDAEAKRGEAESFGARAFPTLILLHPTGKVLYQDSGAPMGDQLMLNLGYKPYKRMYELYNAQKFEEVAADIAYLRRYFKDSGTVSRAADEFYERLKDKKEFVAAYEKAVAAEEAMLAPARTRAEEAEERLRKEEAERRKKRAAEMLKEANKLRVRAKRADAIAKYKQIVQEYPETESAKTAVEKLKRLGVEIELPKTADAEKPDEPKPDAGGKP